MVNSVGLQNKLKKYNIKSHIIRPGYNLDEFYPIKTTHNKVITLGGLYHSKHWFIKRVKWLHDVKIYLRNKNLKTQVFLMGSDNIKIPTPMDKYVKQPTVKQKLNFYNTIDIWLSTSMQEGLHMPPAEAMLTECPVVGTNAELSGTHDYLIHEKTGLVSDNNFQSFSTNVERLVIDEKLRKELGKNARMKILMIGDRKSNMKKMVEFFMEYI
jgi:glycosyltransferase involved in cell wall biosynthesis